MLINLSLFIPRNLYTTLFSSIPPPAHDSGLDPPLSFKARRAFIKVGGSRNTQASAEPCRMYIKDAEQSATS